MDASKNTAEQAATLTEGLAARHNTGHGQKGQPFRQNAAFTGPVMLQETRGDSFETLTLVRCIDHFCWIVGYPPSAASLGCNDVLCQWRFIDSSKGNKLLHCYDRLFWWAHLTLLGILQFQCTHLHKCRIAQKNAEDDTIRWRGVSENFQ